MAITVKFFAGLREELKLSNVELRADELRTALDVWNAATNNLDVPPNTLCAINHEHNNLEHPVADGDEVAFFPPVTGG